MITAEFLGGPRDGEVIALRDATPLRIPLIADMAASYVQRADQPIAANLRYVELVPRQRADGRWFLPWHEAA